MRIIYLCWDNTSQAAALTKLAEDTTAPAVERNHIAIPARAVCILPGRLCGGYALLKPIAVDVSMTANPLLPDAIFLLGDAELQTGHYAEAAEALNQYLAAAPDPKAGSDV